MAHPDLIEAFNACIDRLNAGEPIDDCLRDYAQFAETLRPMLTAGQSVQRATPTVPPGARTRVRAQVMRTLPPRQLRFRPSLATAASLLIVAAVALLIVSRIRSRDHAVHPTTQPVFVTVIATTTTPTATQTPTLTPTQTPTFTSTPTSTQTPTRTSSLTPTQTQTPTFTSTPTSTQTPTRTSSPTQTPTRTSTRTPTPTRTPTRTSSPTQTPQPCMFTIQVSSASLRTGPGTGYDIVGFGYSGDTYRVLARHTSRYWYMVEGEAGGVWIAAETGDLSGECAELPEDNRPYQGGNDDETPGERQETPDRPASEDGNQPDDTGPDDDTGSPDDDEVDHGSSDDERGEEEKGGS